MRINQLSKELDVSNNAIIEILEKNGVTGKSHSSNLDTGQENLVRGSFSAKVRAKATAEPAPTTRQPPVKVVKTQQEPAPQQPAPQPQPPPVLVKKDPPPEPQTAETKPEVQTETATAAPQAPAPMPPIVQPPAPVAAAQQPTQQQKVIPPPITAQPASGEGFSRLKVSTAQPQPPRTQEPGKYITLPAQRDQKATHKPGTSPEAAQEHSKHEPNKPTGQRRGHDAQHSQQRQNKVQRSGEQQQPKTVLPMATNTGKGEVRHEQPAPPIAQPRRPFIPPSISQLQPDHVFTRIRMGEEPVAPAKAKEEPRYIHLPPPRPSGGKGQPQGRGGGRTGRTGTQSGRPGGGLGQQRQGTGPRQTPGAKRPGGPTRSGTSTVPNLGGVGPGMDAGGKGPGRRDTFTGKKKGDKRGRHEQDADALEQKLRQPKSRAGQVAIEIIEEEIGIVMLSEGVTVKELAEKCSRPAKDVVAKLLHRGIFATINQTLDTELAKEIAREFGYLADIVSFEEDLQLLQEEGVGTAVGEKLPRPPVVTIMGHVDHGKTSLLDAIRKSRVAEGEAGGITQAIGAYHVDLEDKEGRERSVVFIDTPGHEAFTKMRARGAKVTDIVILVVAADDGVMPQTIEAISHTKAADVPMVVAINKIDKAGSDPDKVMQMLMHYGVQVETYGGDVPSVNVSAKAKRGLEDLLETVLLVADLRDLRSVYACPAAGSILEAKVDRGRGPVATVLVQQGTLKVGDVFVAGATMGRVRAMFDDRGGRVGIATPSMAVQILGFESIPVSGDNFQVVEDETKGRSIVNFRQEKAKATDLNKGRVTLENLFSTLKEGQVKELPLIIKADNHGSMESLLGSLEKLGTEKVRVRIIHAAVGTVNKNDVILAEASDATVIAFKVGCEREAGELAREGGIDIRSHEIIYKITEEITGAMVGLLDATEKEVVQGHAEVRQIFKVQKSSIAGCSVLDGLAKRSFFVRLRRKNEVLFEGQIKTLRRFKDDVSEVRAGFECGVQLDGFDALLEGDTLEFFTKEKVAATSL